LVDFEKESRRAFTRRILADTPFRISDFRPLFLPQQFIKELNASRRLSGLPFLNPRLSAFIRGSFYFAILRVLCG